jgi:hypothetical protein
LCNRASSEHAKIESQQKTSKEIAMLRFDRRTSGL